MIDGTRDLIGPDRAMEVRVRLGKDSTRDRLTGQIPPEEDGDCKLILVSPSEDEFVFDYGNKNQVFEAVEKLQEIALLPEDLDE